MRSTTHFTVGYFTALFAVGHGSVPALWVWGLQLWPMLDLWLRRFLKMDPLHTVWGYVLTTALLWSLTPWWWLGSLSYALHLLLDILTPTGIKLFAPTSQKTVRLPIPHSDVGVLIVSLIGIVVMLVKLS